MSRSPLPRSIVWEVTGRCDLKCAHCYNVWAAEDQTAPSDLSTEEGRRVLESVAATALSLESLTFSGGEPLLRADLPVLVSEAKRLLPETQLSVSTNGQRLSPAAARELKARGADVVQLTLLSGDPEMHDGMVGKTGAMDRVLAAISSAKGADLLVAVFFVATRGNIEDFPGAAKLALAVGADTVVFNRFQPGGRGLAGWKELTPSPGQLSTACAQIEELRAITDVSLGTILPPCEMPRATVSRRDIFRCPIGTRNAYPAIGPDGLLRPCNHSSLTAGSVLEQGLDELLQQSCMTALTRGRLPAECTGCDWAAACNGGCPAARQLVGEQVYACHSPCTGNK